HPYPHTSRGQVDSPPHAPHPNPLPAGERERVLSTPPTPTTSPGGERERVLSTPPTPTLSPEGERERVLSTPLTPTLSPEGERERPLDAGHEPVYVVHVAQLLQHRQACVRFG